MATGPVRGLPSPLLGAFPAQGPPPPALRLPRRLPAPPRRRHRRHRQHLQGQHRQRQRRIPAARTRQDLPGEGKKHDQDELHPADCLRCSDCFLWLCLLVSEDKPLLS
ncbi:CD59 glycoprotein isoform X3 [Prinia subflava]|uniref:CD59 glycoprotein isoform X3 n=1 Tax=Prinia subflava TaxID=208062 RepID=UPI002FE10CBB